MEIAAVSCASNTAFLELSIKSIAAVLQRTYLYKYLKQILLIQKTKGNASEKRGTREGRKSTRGLWWRLISGVVQDLANARGGVRPPRFLLLAQSCLYHFHLDDKCPVQRSRGGLAAGDGANTCNNAGLYSHCLPVFLQFESNYASLQQTHKVRDTIEVE